MKRILLTLLLVSVVFVAACRTSDNQPILGTCTLEARTCPDGSIVGRVPPKCDFEPCPTSDSGTGSSTGTSTSSLKKFTMTAKQWEFVPSTITVNEGDEVELTITSTDVAHGFGLPTFGVSETIEAGKTTTVKFTASKKGTFTFFCNVQCGQGHKDMKGTLIVQ